MFLMTIAPPLWTHCHQDCSLADEECCGAPQETGADDGSCCGDSVAHCTVELKHRRNRPGGQCWASDCNDNVSHYHLAWLGMMGKMPVGKQSQQLNGESQHMVFLHETSAPLKESGSSSCIDSPVDLETGTVIGCVLPQLRDRTDLPADVLLCDVARRERTGVLVV